MKVKVTVSGVIELEPTDVKLLNKAEGPDAMDTLKQLAPKLTVDVEIVRKPTPVKAIKKGGN